MTTGTKTDWPIHGRITGPIVMIGFGSIGRGTLPLIERHFEHDKARFTVVEPSDAHKSLAEKHDLRFEQVALTPENYRDVLTPLLTEGGRTVISGSLETYLGALGKSTGRELWGGRTRVGGQGEPMTYISEDGKQYIVVVAGGATRTGSNDNRGDDVIAYALP